ncbi:MAG: Tail Collar domain protein [Acidobacteria bacterium]|nr:Tail Collar domain protein [Acidobacteriota bacterium]
MGTPFMSEIRIFSFNFAPKGWAQCNGQFLPINQNQALFSLLGTTYGGNGQTTFALPDLRGRVPFHTGQSFVQGQAGGQEVHTLTLSEMPTHTHTLVGNNAVVGAATNATLGVPTNNYWANAGKNVFTTGQPNSVMSPGTVSNTGGSQPHENRSPYLVLTYCIALVGVFPSRN